MPASSWSVMPLTAEIGLRRLRQAVEILLFESREPRLAVGDLRFLAVGLGRVEAALVEYLRGRCPPLVGAECVGEPGRNSLRNNGITVRVGHVEPSVDLALQASQRVENLLSEHFDAKVALQRLQCGGWIVLAPDTAPGEASRAQLRGGQDGVVQGPEM